MTAVATALLLIALIPSTLQLFYASSRVPRELCYVKYEDARDIVVQVPNPGCLTADLLQYCEFDWYNDQQVVVRHKEVCCPGYETIGEVCVRKCGVSASCE